MNRPVRKVAIACMLLFAALLINANVVQVAEAGKLKRRPDNGRQLTERLSRERGQITATDGAVLASTKPVNDTYKFQRTYPFNALYSAATGYYGLFSSSGIEKSEDDLLSGEDNRLFVSRVSDLVTGRKPKGGTVQLTLDPKAQFAAANALGSHKGAVVALDPSTGAILALVTSPAFNPNPLASHDTKVSSAAFGALTKNPDTPLIDRALQQTYPPGSTFKVITSAAALSSGRYNPQTEIPSPNVLKLPQTTSTLSNFGGESCGAANITLTEALTISCNTAFGQLGMTLGASALQQQAEAFGFNKNLDGFPLSSAKSVFPGGINAPQTAQSAIGQFDVRVTPLQMAMVAAAIGNGGVEMKPYIVKDQLGPDLKSISKTSPQQLGQPITADVASALTQMMESVVQSANGTGTPAQIGGVEVAGKTGTAQHGTGENPHAWFISFAPAQHPKVAVAVVVEDGGSAGAEATGGTVAAPIARAVMTTVLGQG